MPSPREMNSLGAYQIGILSPGNVHAGLMTSQTSYPQRDAQNVWMEVVVCSSPDCQEFKCSARVSSDKSGTVAGTGQRPVWSCDRFQRDQPPFPTLTADFFVPNPDNRTCRSWFGWSSLLPFLNIRYREVWRTAHKGSS